MSLYADSPSESAKVVVTTSTAHTKLLDWDINLFSIEHYLHIHGNTEFPEIYKIRMNFGRQRNPVTEKRIFFTAIWFNIRCPIGPKPHNLCLKFWQNGSLHVTGLLDHRIETPWLTEWIANFLTHIQNQPIECTLQKESSVHDLLVCNHHVVWSPVSKRPIGWIPPSRRTDEKAVIILHGKPVRFDKTSCLPFVTTKGKVERFDNNGDKILELPHPEDASEEDFSAFMFAVTNHPWEDYKTVLKQRLGWKIVCINGKCENACEAKRKQWLSRDHFARYMREVYRNIMTSFDPNPYKAVKLTFFADQKCEFLDPGAIALRAAIKSDKAAPNVGNQVGTIGVTSTGLFWLYGFKDLGTADEVANEVLNILNIYKNQASEC